MLVSTYSAVSGMDGGGVGEVHVRSGGSGVGCIRGGRGCITVQTVLLSLPFTHTHTHIHTHTHTHIHTYTHVHAHTYIHTHMCMHTLLVRVWDIRPFAPAERQLKVFHGSQHNFEKVR